MNYDKRVYEQDFPEHGTFNWKTVILKTPNEPYYDGRKTMGVLLHDNNFMVNGVLFLENQYEIINHDPMNLTEKPEMVLTEKDVELLKDIHKYLYDVEWARRKDAECMEKTAGNLDYRDVLGHRLNVLREKFKI